jgi:hypothetical protein
MCIQPHRLAGLGALTCDLCCSCVKTS